MFQDTATHGGLVQWLIDTTEPWNKLYSHNKTVSATVLFLHLAPLIFAAGAAFVADRATLRALRASGEERVRHLAELHRTHPLIIGGLALSFISGILMFLSDVETFLGSIFLWIKLTLVALLCVNGLVMMLTEKGLAKNKDDAALWGRLKTVAILSGVLWFATTLAGVVLKEFA
jgi:hypothetical protein